jgi:hypothetical protein
MLMFVAVSVILIWSSEVKAQSIDSVYWVVETNIHNPTFTIVHFYNYRNVKVHEVRMQGVYLDIRNPKHRKKLDLLTKQYHERILTSSKRKKVKNTI